MRFDFPMNFITAPLVADLFLLAILAIGAKEVKGGTLGDQGIVPYDIMLFFLSLALAPPLRSGRCKTDL